MSIRVPLLLTAIFVCGGVTHAQSDNLLSITIPVTDLVVPAPSKGDPKKPLMTPAQLIERIQTEVAPKSWARAGGSGTIAFEGNGLNRLQVRQSREVLTEIFTFMEKLPRGEITMEVRILQISERAFEEFTSERKPKWTESDGIHHALFDDIATYGFLSFIQGDRSTHIMQMPKMNVWNGQSLNCDFIDRHRNARRSPDQRGQSGGRPAIREVLRGNQITIPADAFQRSSIDFDPTGI